MKKSLSLHYHLLHGHSFNRLGKSLLCGNNKLLYAQSAESNGRRLMQLRGFQTDDNKLIESINNLKKPRDSEIDDKSNSNNKIMSAIDSHRFVLAIDINPAFGKSPVTVMTIPVTLRNIPGHLNRFDFFPDHQNVPSINPSLLEVDGNIPVNCIGSIDKIEGFQFSSLIQSDDLLNWYLAANALLKAVTGLGIDTIESHPGFNFEDPDVVISLRGINSDDSANGNILKLYEEVFRTKDEVLLKTSLTNADQAYHESSFKNGENWLTDNYMLQLIEASQSTFLAHMDERKGADTEDYAHRELFALDNTQRGVAYVAAAMSTGDVLAVNGPPGSGKTAMLKAVISHQYVDAALNQAECPIVFGVGGTNQSVTNIVNAFPNVLYKGTGKPLYHMKRWITGPDNYGTYFPSETAKKAAAEDAVLGEIDHVNKGGVVRWQGALKKLNDPSHLDDLITEYLSNAKTYFGECIDSLDEVISRLHSTLSDKAETAKTLYRELVATFDEGFDTPPQTHPKFAKYFDITKYNSQGADLINTLYTLAQGTLEEKHKIYSDVCREYIRDEQLEGNEQALTKKDAELTRMAKVIIADRVVDLLVRSELFHYAARYWEGRYLAECNERLLIYASPSNLEAGLRRMCMLTPILVSTVQSAPKLFSYAKPPGLKDSPYLLGKADLLIIDEAGQADIRTTLPLLALSRKTIAVGDIAQIPPVITDASPITEQGFYHTLKMGVNEAHTRKCFVHAFKNKLLPSLNGSILHVLREISFYNHQQKGMTLRGHYRCQETLSQFCNELVYDNKIFIIPPLFKAKGPYPPLSWVSSVNKTEKVGTSHKNTDEARNIVEWIADQWPTIYDHYNKDPHAPVKKIYELIGIISPYKAQSLVFLGRQEDQLDKIGNARGMLHEHLVDAFKGTQYAITVEDIDKMKIGTVNALQGAEKPIILFSGTKSVKHGGDIHYRSEAYILNVAISRAKECFIAFVCERTFGIPTQPDELQAPNDPQSDSVGYLGYYIGKRGQRLYPRNVVIIESDNKIDTLQKHLGKSYRVLSTQGKLLELPLEDPEAISVKDGLFPNYQYLSKKGGSDKRTREAVRAILNECSRSDIDEIILATDDDFVGEHIAWHLQSIFLQHQPQNMSKLHRVRLRGLTKEAISDAFNLDNQSNGYANKQPINLGVASAEMVREILDFLISRKLNSITRQVNTDGLTTEEKLVVQKRLVSPTTKKSVTGIGRVKAAILSLVYDHLKKQIQSIQHPTSTSVTVTVGDKKIKGRLIQRKTPDNLNKVSKTIDTVANRGEPQKSDGKKWRVTSAQFEERQSSPPDASTIKVMRENALRAGITPTETYKALTSLYEGKYK